MLLRDNNPPHPKCRYRIVIKIFLEHVLSAAVQALVEAMRLSLGHASTRMQSGRLSTAWEDVQVLAGCRRRSRSRDRRPRGLRMRQHWLAPER